MVGEIVKDVYRAPVHPFYVEAIPRNVQLGAKVEFRIKICGGKITKKRTTDLHVQVVYGYSQRGVLIPQTMRNKDGSWVCTFTPICGGHHTIQFNKTKVKSKNIYVTGIPQIGARVRRGPDWNLQVLFFGVAVGRVVGFNSLDQSLRVRWNEERQDSSYSYRWRTYYDI